MGWTAAAQPLAREPQQRQVVVPSSAGEPVPEVRVAAGVVTLFKFDAPVDRASVEVEGRATRFRLVDAGERTLVLEMAVEPGATEKLGVRVRYRDGTSPTHATFALVSHPTLVDRDVEVVRRPRTLEALEAALAEKEAELAALRAVSGPAGLVFSGRLDSVGVQARRIERVSTRASSGLKVAEAMGYRARYWALVVISVSNLPGQKPWAAAEARVTRADGTPVKVLSVDMNKARLVPGEECLVAVETEAPSWKENEVLRLELLDRSGDRRLLLSHVEL